MHIFKKIGRQGFLRGVLVSVVIPSSHFPFSGAHSRCYYLVVISDLIP